MKRKYEERTRALRSLYRRIEAVTDQELINAVLKAYPELVLLTEGVVATPAAPEEIAKGSVAQALLPEELNWLGSQKDLAYPKQVGSVPAQLESSVSKSLYGKAYPEFDRTMAALLLFKKLLKGDYEGFVQGQPENVRLQRESFLEISKLVRRVAFNTSTRDALFSFLIFNNIGKSKAIINYLKASAGIGENNHQRVMAQVLSHYSFISPTFQRLDEHQRQMVLNSFEKEFNLGQMIQGEAPAAFILEHAKRSKEERDFYLATSLLKIAAAAGQVNVNGSIVMKQPTYDGIKMVLDSMQNMEASEAAVVQAHQNFLRRRSQTFIPEQYRDQLWITSACLMFRCQSVADGQGLIEALNSLSVEDKRVLQKEFSATGFGNDSASLLYYGPDTLTNLKKEVDASKFYHLGTKLLVKVFRAARQEIIDKGLKGVVQVRMDSIGKAVQEKTSLSGPYSVEVYNDPSYGLSVKLKASANGCDRFL